MRKNFLLLMLLALLPLTGFAAELVNSTQYDSDGFQYVIKSMTKTGSTWTGTVSVKQNIFSGAALTIKDVVPINVEGTVSGEECKQTVTFKVVEIEANGFKDVTGVTSITIGSNISAIGEGAFDGCTDVTAITFQANTNNMTIGNDAFKGTKPTTVDLSPITGTLAAVNKWWGNSAFVPGTEVNSTLTTITFPRKVASIVEDAFAGFTALKNVNFTAQLDAENVKLTIGQGAFQETPIVKLDLTNAKISGTNPGDGLNKLFEDDNVTLKKVVMSKWVEQLNENALANCIQLGIGINANELGTGSAAEDGGINFTQSTKLKTLAAGSLSNTVVATYDFSHCYELNALGTVYTTNLDFQATVNPFVNAVTKTNKNLVTVVLPKADALACPVTVIGTTFANCEVLTTITNLSKSSIIAVVDGAFANDIALTELTFPKTLVTVSGAPFAGCKKLATLNFEAQALTQLGTVAAPAIPAVYAQLPITYVMVDGVTYYTSADGSTSVVYEDGVSDPNDGTNYWEKTSDAVPAVDGQDLFGEYKHVTNWSPLTYEDFDAPLQNLNIFLSEAEKTTSVKINEAAFFGNGVDNSALKNVNIAVASGTYDGIAAVAGTFKGTIVENAIVLSSKEDATVVFGDIVDATFAPMVGLKGTTTAALTTGKYTSATLTEVTINGEPVKAIIAGKISVATIGGDVATTGGNVLTAINQAAKIVFSGDIKGAIDAPVAANALLTHLEFNGLIKDADNNIPATAFDENKAPLLVDVKYQPATDPTKKIFNQKTFGTASKGVDAKITLHTTTKIKAMYDNSELQLFNVKLFDALDPEAEPVEIAVYGTAAADYFYGKHVITAGSRLSISKTNDDGDQVEVYTAFVDSKDQKIYMDRLSLKNGNYVVAANEPFIVRVKTPTTTEAHATISGGLVAKVKAYATTQYSTMRYVKKGSSSYEILNDLQVTDKVFSSDYIGTNYVGKTLYAMANPAKEGTLQFDPVAKTSYLPKGALFVETVENASSAAPLEIVWLDGDENLTGIIERISEDKAALNNVIYNLAGQKVGADYKGIIIKNGKKFVVK